jgi:hypothetical protein
MVKAESTSLLHLSIYAVLIILTTIIGCSKREKSIQVLPGKSVAGVELGMSEEQVLSILGQPTSQSYKDDMDRLGGVYDVAPDGKYERVPLEKIENMKVLMYQTPPLTVLIDKNNKVGRLSLSYCEEIFVKEYAFLKFVYLTEEEMRALGEPASITRMKDSETKMISVAPKGTILEFYEYHYDTVGINLGLVFDRTKQKSSKHFIGVNHIDIYSTQK